MLSTWDLEAGQGSSLVTRHKTTFLGRELFYKNTVEATFRSTWTSWFLDFVQPHVPIYLFFGYLGSLTRTREGLQEPWEPSDGQPLPDRVLGEHFGFSQLSSSLKCLLFHSALWISLSGENLNMASELSVRSLAYQIGDSFAWKKILSFIYGFLASSSPLSNYKNEYEEKARLRNKCNVLIWSI